jgi:molybdopterin-guanine dinucleotide biosynthesis protein A
MGTAKAALAWHDSTLLRRVVGLVARGVDGPVVVVRSPGDGLPRLPIGVEVIEDDGRGAGPLAALAVGLAALHDRADLVFAAATDMPFLHPAFVAAVLAAVEPGAGAAVPTIAGRRQPLAAAYRPSLATRAAALVESGRGGVNALAPPGSAEPDEIALLARPDVARLDPTLRSVRNLNRPEQYAAALAEPLPVVLVERCDRRTPVAAATAGAAVRAAGLAWEAVVLRLDGRPVGDPQTPLLDRDLLVLADAAPGPDG